MKLIIKTMLLAFILLSGISVRAQDDGINYDFNYNKTGKNKGGASFSFNQLRLSFPLKTGSRSGFSLGPEGSILNVSNSVSVADSISLKTIAFKVGFHYFSKKNTLFIVDATPLIASDFKDISGEDIRFRSLAAVMFHPERKFSYGFGLTYQYQFSGSQLLPLIVLVWHISDAVTLSGPLPLIPHLDFKLNPKWSVGGGLKGEYSSYRLSATIFNSRYVQYQSFNLGASAKYRPEKKLEFGGFMGIGTGKIEVYNQSEKIPLEVFGWKIGGGSHQPYFVQSYKGLALNFSIAYRF